MRHSSIISYRIHHKGYRREEEEKKREEKKAERKEDEIQLLDATFTAWGGGECLRKSHFQKQMVLFNHNFSL